MEHTSALSYPVLQLKMQDSEGNWHAYWTSEANTNIPFSGREDLELFTWFLSGAELGSIKGWARAIREQATIGFPLHFHTNLTTTMRKKRNSYLKRTEKSHFAHLGTIKKEDLLYTIQQPLFQNLPESVKKDAKKWIKSINKTPINLLWEPEKPWERNINRTAHKHLEDAARAQSLNPDSIAIDIYCLPEYEIFNNTIK